MSKLLERLAQSRLRPHLVTSPGYSTFQSAYRPRHSTETAIIKITNDLLSSTSTGSPSVVATLDLSAAFDCVNHNKLIVRLGDDFGVGGLALDWVTSYLGNRSQYVKVGQESSKTVSVLAGVPQGSVLGPLLFTVYIAPIEQLINSFGLKYIAYADDITLYINLCGCVNTVLHRLSGCSKAIETWLMFHDLQLNPAKSELLLVGTNA